MYECRQLIKLSKFIISTVFAQALHKMFSLKFIRGIPNLQYLLYCYLFPKHANMGEREEVRNDIQKTPNLRNRAFSPNKWKLPSPPFLNSQKIKFPDNGPLFKYLKQLELLKHFQEAHSNWWQPFTVQAVSFGFGKDKLYFTIKFNGNNTSCLSCYLLRPRENTNFPGKLASSM